MKDFNNLSIGGKLYSKNELLELSANMDEKPNWSLDFCLFIQQWLNDSVSIKVNTSGSTGKAKSIEISKAKMLVSAAMTCDFFNLRKGDTALLCLSPKHIGGMMMIVRALYAKLNLILKLPNANPLEDVNDKINFIALVPYQVKTILDQNPEKLAKIPHVIIGGGQLDFALQQSLQHHQVESYSTFGMTETISHIALQKIGSEGQYTCLDGIHVERSSRGTITVHAPSLMEEPLETNDLIELISSKQFKWLGRTDFAIESGGLKFIPEAIERKLESKIQGRFIISSRPHLKLNNELIIIIEGEQSFLDAHLFDSLGKYEQPRAVFFVKALAETANGKIDRIKSRLLI